MNRAMHRTIVLAAALAGALPASAQRLDLGGASVLVPEERPAARALIDAVEASLADEIDRVAPRDPDDPDAPRPEASSLPPTVPLELRRLALALARRSTAPGGDARDQLWARTIASYVEAFDEGRGGPVPGVPEALRLLADDPPRGDAFDRALRDALAPLLSRPLALSAGWSMRTGTDPWAPIDAIDPAASPSAWAAFEAVRAISPETVPVALVPAAGILRARGSAALALYRPVPSWVSRDLIDRHAVALLASLAEAAGGNADANARLDALGAVATAKRALDDLPSSRSTTEARRLAVRIVTDRLDRSPIERPRTLSSSLDAVARLARVIRDPEGVPDRDRVVRHLRPAWPRLLDQRRRARERLVDVLPGVVLLERPGSEPSFVAMLTDAEAADHRLVQLVDASVVLAEGSFPTSSRAPAPTDRFEALADRLLALLQRTPDRRDDPSPLRPDHAEAVLFTFLSDVERFIPGRDGGPEASLERVMSAAGPSASHGVSVRRAAWERLTSGRPNEFLDALGSRREAWLDAWNAHVRPHRNPDAEAFDVGGGEPARRHARWLSAADRWFGLAEPAVALAEARDRLRRNEGSFADRWPGWAMDARLVEALLGPYELRLSQAAGRLAAGDAVSAERLLAQIEREDAVARLASVIEAELAAGVEDDPWWRGMGEIDRALGELAAGACDAGWSAFGPARDAIAEACVWSYEAAASRGETRRGFAEAADRAALRALRRLDRP